MEAAQQIRDAVDQISRLRQSCAGDSALRDAVTRVKSIQSRRFAGTYTDLLSGGPFAAAARFFLEELYSDRDFAERDAQFARIAGAVQRLFPHQVSATAVALAQLHLLTEQLDHAMGLAFMKIVGNDAGRYVEAWRIVGQREQREAQLRVVMEIGREMIRLTRTPGLRLMLRMMRAPASAAGLASLQSFLEAGFDTFGAMARERGRAEEFLEIVSHRESALMVMLFEAPTVACETELQRTLGLAR